MTSKIVKKAWGNETIWADNDKYCAKFLNFTTGSKFSMHFHAEKLETWYVLSGKFLLKWIDTKNAKQCGQTLEIGQTWTNQQLVPHQLFCLEEGTIIEVSTKDSEEDNYRVLPGDNQS